MKTIIQLFFAGFIFILPLFYSFQTQQIFEVNKFYFFSLGVSLLTITSIFFIWKNQKFLDYIASKSRNFWIALLAFLIIISISSGLALSPIIAFLGGSTRHQGAIFLLILLVLFFLIQYFFSGKNTQQIISSSTKFLIIPLILAAIISSLLAIDQWKGNQIITTTQKFLGEEKNELQTNTLGSFDGVRKFLSEAEKRNIKEKIATNRELTWKEHFFTLFDFHYLKIKGISMRSMGAIGQPNFLAQFFIIPFFLTLYLLFSQAFMPKKKPKHYFFLGTTFFTLTLIIFADVATGSRAGMLGIFSGLIVLPLLFLTEQKNNQKILWIGLASLVSIGIAGIVASIISPEILNFIGERSRSFVARIQFWKESVPLLLSNWKIFFLGIGADNFGQFFQPLASIRLNELEGFSYLPDRTHMIWIDFPMQYGVPAFVLFLTFLGKIFWDTVQTIFNSKTEKTQKFFLMSIFSGLLGTLVSWTFGFPVTTDSTIFIIFLAILALLSQQNFLRKKVYQYAFRNFWKSGLTILCLIFAGGVMTNAVITRSSDIATYQLNIHAHQTNDEYTDSLNMIFSAPHLESNLLSVFEKIAPQDQKKIIKIGEKYHYHSASFYMAKLQYALIFSNNSLEISEYFNTAKYAIGNNIDSHVLLFDIAKYFEILSPTDELQYAEEIGNMVPEKYHTRGIDPDIQKFWKHHPSFQIILDYLKNPENSLSPNVE